MTGEVLETRFVIRTYGTYYDPGSATATPVNEDLSPAFAELPSDEQRLAALDQFQHLLGRVAQRGFSYSQPKIVKEQLRTRSVVGITMKPKWFPVAEVSLLVEA